MAQGWPGARLSMTPPLPSMIPDDVSARVFSLQSTLSDQGSYTYFKIEVLEVADASTGWMIEKGTTLACLISVRSIETCGQCIMAVPFFWRTN